MDLRSRWFAVAVTSVFAAALGAGTARADIQVHVMNCTSQTVQAQAYDSKDSVKLLPASSDSYSQNGSGSLHCAGEGKGYCQMYVTILNASANCNVKGSNFHLDSGKWAVVTKFVKTSAANDSYTCTLEISENLDSGSCN